MTQEKLNKIESEIEELIPFLEETDEIELECKIHEYKRLLFYQFDI